MKVKLAVIFGFSLLLSSAAFVRADAEYVLARSLIKCPDYSSVYYIADDGNRYAFQNEKTYYSWYKDFSRVKTVACEDLAAFNKGGVLTYQPGTRLLKIPSAPTVYAVAGRGVLRAIPDEATARMLYGENWGEYVDDLSEAFWPAYTVGDPLATMEIPDGIRIYIESIDTYYQFQDGTPLILPSEFEQDHPELLPYIVTKEQSPELYGRSEPAALQSQTMINEEEYENLGVPELTTGPSELPAVFIVQ